MILGENHFISIADDGSIRFIKRLDYSPMCFHCFIIGWYWGECILSQLIITIELNSLRHTIPMSRVIYTLSIFCHEQSSVHATVCRHIPGWLILNSQNSMCTY